MFNNEIPLLLDDGTNDDTDNQSSSDNDDYEEISSDDWDIQPENDLLEKSNNDDENKLIK